VGREQCFPRLGLQRREVNPALGVPWNDELDDIVTEVADAVEQEDRVVRRRIALVPVVAHGVSSARLLGDATTSSPGL